MGESAIVLVSSRQTQTECIRNRAGSFADRDKPACAATALPSSQAMDHQHSSRFRDTRHFPKRSAGRPRAVLRELRSARWPNYPTAVPFAAPQRLQSIFHRELRLIPEIGSAREVTCRQTVRGRHRTHAQVGLRHQQQIAALGQPLLHRLARIESPHCFIEFRPVSIGEK